MQIGGKAPIKQMKKVKKGQKKLKEYLRVSTKNGRKKTEKKETFDL